MGNNENRIDKPQHHYLVELPEDLVLQVKEAHQFTWGCPPLEFSRVVEEALWRELTRLKDILKAMEEREIYSQLRFYDEKAARRKKREDTGTTIDLPPVPISMVEVLGRYCGAMKMSHPTWAVHKSHNVGENLALGTFYVDDGTSLVRHHLDLVGEARNLGLLRANEVVNE